MNDNLLDDELHPPEFFDDLNVQDRLVSMMKDHFIFCLTIIPISTPFFICAPDSKITDAIFYFIVGLYSNKDILGARSIAKRISGQIVIDTTTGKPASEIKCAIRNFTAMFWIIEGIVIFFSPNRRIGDFIAGTKVVRTGKSNLSDMVSELGTIDTSRFLISLIVSIISAWLIFNFIIPILPIQELRSMLIYISE